MTNEPTESDILATSQRMHERAKSAEGALIEILMRLEGCLEVSKGGAITMIVGKESSRKLHEAMQIASKWRAGEWARLASAEASILMTLFGWLSHMSAWRRTGDAAQMVKVKDSLQRLATAGDELVAAMNAAGLKTYTMQP